MAESYVGKPCPKCKHVRTPSEVSPDWQCPKCGVAYAKFLAAQAGMATTMSGSVRAGSVAEQVRAGQALRGQGGSGSTGLAMFAHLSILIGFIVPFFSLIVPIVIWITKKDSDQLATANAKEAINLQISMLIYMLLIVGLAFLGRTMIFVAGGLLLILVIAYVVLPIIAAVKANGGEEYRYPFTVHIFS